MIYDSKKYQSVLNIDITYGNELTYLLRKSIHKVNLQSEVVKGPGVPIKFLICKTYPFYRSPYSDNKYIVWKMNPQVNYKLWCTG